MYLSICRHLGALWGGLALVVVLVESLHKLTSIALGAFTHPLGLAEGLFLLGWVCFMAYAEGYRGFQQSFAPRYAARAHWLKEKGQRKDLCLAPFFCMGFYAASRRTQTVAWALSFGIPLLVYLIRALPQPWRGLVDLGVIVGLSWGLVAVLYTSFQALIHNQVYVDPDITEEKTPRSYAE